MDIIVARDLVIRAHEHPFDALMNAHGPVLRIFDMWSVATFDATDLLREFARWCALQAINKWDAPDVVREYLETGDESLYARVVEAVSANHVKVAEARVVRAALSVPAVAVGAAVATVQRAQEVAEIRAEGWAPRLARRETRAAQRVEFKQMVDNATACDILEH